MNIQDNNNNINYSLFRELKTAVEENNFLKFQQPIECNERPMQGIFIRQCYRHLLENILDNTNNFPPKSKSFLIIGDPGMGKTYFSYYLIHYLITNNNTKQLQQHVLVVYDCVENRRVYYYDTRIDQFGQFRHVFNYIYHIKLDLFMFRC